jgi:hypothetical protein
LGKKRIHPSMPMKIGMQRSIRFRFSGTEKNLEANAGI